MENLIRFLTDESGATAIEYALIATLVSVGIISSLNSFSAGLADVFSTVSTAMTAVVAK
jgi:pilus assembly protein Flp/PilA